MNILSKQELSQTYGGGIKLGIVAAIVGLGTFLIGVVDGYIRPLKCYKKWY